MKACRREASGGEKPLKERLDSCRGGITALIVRQMNEKDFEPYERLSEESYVEYLESPRLSNPKQYHKERQEKRKVTHARFNFYLKAGSSFVAEEKGKS